MTRLHQLHELGQSTWLNYMRHSFIQSGELRARMADGIQGITANAAAFEKIIAACADYDPAIRQEVAAGTPAQRIHEALMIRDVQVTADYLHAVYEESDSLDGFVSLELNPALMHDTVHTVAEVRHLENRLNRPNVMVEVPATPAGIEAIRELTRDGVCLNVTHVFSIAVYERVAQAYIEGLEIYLDSHSVWRRTPTAVASFSVSAIDTAVDPLLAAADQPALQGKTAVALARLLYTRCQEIFRGPRWDKMARRGGRILRPKWTRTTPRDFTYPDTFYVDALVGPDTVTTFSPGTLNAFLDHGQVAPALATRLDEAWRHLTRLAELGIDLDAVLDKLQANYLRGSEKRFQSLTQVVSQKRDTLESGWQRMHVHAGTHETAVNRQLSELNQDQVISRIWAHDPSVWPVEPSDSLPRLGWLHVTAVMQENVNRMRTLTQTVLADGCTTALFIGNADVTMLPQLFYNAFGKPAQPRTMPHPYLELVTLDADDSKSLAAMATKLEPALTLFVIADKSGSETTLAAAQHLHHSMADVLGAASAGRHFVVITDPDTPLLAWASQNNVRHVFINDPHIGSQYNALSYFGLVPAALVGADLNRLLARAVAAAANAETSYAAMIEDNRAAKLGALLAELGQHGREYITLVPSLALTGLGDWVAQLLGSCLGRRLEAAVGTPPAAPETAVPGGLYVHLRLTNDTSHDVAMRTLAEAGQPVVTLHLEDLYDVGEQLFLWQMATAVAGHILGLNPFAESRAAGRPAALFRERRETALQTAPPVPDKSTETRRPAK